MNRTFFIVSEEISTAEKLRKQKLRTMISNISQKLSARKRTPYEKARLSFQKQAVQKTLQGIRRA